MINSDIFFPRFLTAGQLVTGTSKAWLGGFGELGKPYAHPSTKQCDAAASNHTHIEYAPSDLITMSTVDITAGSTALATGKLYIVYE